MKVFHCDHCGNLVFFENVQCLQCGAPLGFLPDVQEVGSLEPAGEGLFTSPGDKEQRHYRLCENYTQHNVCNWAIPATDDHELCGSCRVTQVIPDLSVPGHKQAWFKLEVAKRRLAYSIFALGLPVENREVDPDGGIAFEFLADPPKDAKDAKPVLTGHANGVITINIAEADDAERERRRLAMHEPYRTLLGHFRHEVGHYYWDRLIRDTDRLEPFRQVFGDERQDYGEALKRHYANGPPPDWQGNFVTTYATAHPWEDWAETWAHYLHMTDVLETAACCGVSLRPREANKPTLKAVPDPTSDKRPAFDRLIESWFPLTYMLNSLNRGMGLPDGYPFVLSPPVIEKLRFIHDTVAAQRPKTATKWLWFLG
ncbi:MAG: putative zinc-binding peptidase [Pirellulaceae bacterium]|nr:putative zinc-binding peptidase [Pirellulaceae bacterium]